ncbi:glutathione-dependent reductase [Haladaptatus sp. W1]|uniref:glutathione S-transferase family protein n=1 Tax=Haladaptatus sp. W1 TaxID=1897478 RepID=UPI000849B104|nr:glutathione S-transferase family protein [Haladaptatus sp. W1]ODR81184.1 glutathione-dependent reductase [Haladaptatus sp. W1]
MNMLVDGEWRTDAYESTNEEGEFERQTTSFREWVEDDPESEFPAESGRYHLYISYACPWAHRTLLVRSLKGLEDHISVSVVDPHRQNDGWEFSPDRPGCTADNANGAEYLREVYVKADPEFTGRVTVPVLWDEERETVVNNESAEIMRMFDTAFDDIADRDVTLYPETYREEVDETIEAIYDPINNGVYRAGFAETQTAYEAAVSDLFDALDRWEEVLADRRYLCGPELTEADLCLFTTLVRFDAVYATHFKCNVHRITDYPNLWNYLKELAQLPDVAETVRMDHIKEHYYRSHADINPTGIVPVGPDLDFDADHDRERLAGGPPDEIRR